MLVHSQTNEQANIIVKLKHLQKQQMDAAVALMAIVDAVQVRNNR